MGHSQPNEGVDFLFLCAGLAWAGYTVAMRQARLGGLHAAAIAAVASLVFYVPIYAAVSRGSLFKAPIADVALQAVVQGILTAIVALLLYGRMVAILGATAGAAFVALTPATTALLAIPVLGEWPSVIDWIAITVISVGVAVRPPIADTKADTIGAAERAMCGRLRVGKENLHVAGLVGAAMCSAFECGSHDRWP